MGLNKIELPDSLIAGLYKNSLIENDGGNTAPPLQKTATKKALQYLGNNQKNICLLVNYENEVYLPDDQLNFLTSILQACNLNMGDVAIVNHYLQKPLFEDLKEQLNCKYLLIFGIDITLPGLKKIPEFSAEKISDCIVVLSAEPGQLNHNSTESRLLKSKLWLCLKQLFNV